MRKVIIAHDKHEATMEKGWLSLDDLAQVEVTSEDPAHPIESALKPNGGTGWRAADPGPQVIRLVFDHPTTVRRIMLTMEEEERPRTQEFVLRWSDDQGRSYHELVRQQYNFAPPGTMTEQEEYTVNLAGATSLELEINPDINRSAAKASLARLRLA